MTELHDTFRGDNENLIASIEALLELDAEGALVPHGIGGHARALLGAAAVRLAASTVSDKQETIYQVWANDDRDCWIDVEADDYRVRVPSERRIVYTAKEPQS